MDTLPNDVLLEMGKYLNLPDVARSRRISKRFSEVLQRLSRQRKSVCLEHFPGYGINEPAFHCADSMVAYLFNMSRDDVIGTSAFERLSIWNQETNNWTENETNMRYFFSSFQNIQYIMIDKLTEFMVQELSTRYTNLKGLSFRSANVAASVFEQHFSGLEIIAFGDNVRIDFVKQVIRHLKSLRVICFTSPDPDYVSNITFDIIHEINPSVREIFFGICEVNLSDTPPPETKNVTSLEILNPLPGGISKFIRHVLPSFEKLQYLAINLRDTEKSLDLERNPISLIDSLKDLTSLTIIVCQPILPFGQIFGTRSKLEILKIAGELTPNCNNHLAYFDLEQMKQIVDCTPNLRYLCFFPWLLDRESIWHETRRYVEVYTNLRKLEVLHMPTTSFDDRIVEIFFRRMPQLKRVEFVGRYHRDVRRAAEQRLKLLKQENPPASNSKLKIVYQNGQPFCNCPYSKTSCRNSE